jgi:hypothetical protein
VVIYPLYPVADQDIDAFLGESLGRAGHEVVSRFDHAGK